MKLNKGLFFFIILFFSNFILGQKPKKQLDSLFNRLLVMRSEGKLKESLVLCKELISGYEQLKDEEKALKTYFIAANVSSNLYNTKESLAYLDIAAKKNEVLKDDDILTKINAEYGRNYKNLGFYNLALDYYQKAIEVAKKTNNKINLGYCYGLRSVVYEEQKDYAKMYSDLRKAHEINPSTYTASRLAKYFISLKKNTDSAKFYLDLGNKYNTLKKLTPFEISILDRNWGRYYLEKGDYKSAVSYLEKSLEISRKLKKPQDIKDTHKLLADAYKLMNQPAKAALSLEKYTVITDSLSTEKQKIQDFPIKKIIQEKEISTQKTYTKLYILIALTIILFLAIYSYTLKRHNARKKENIALLNTKEEENVQLQQKVNESFEDIIQLAKSNSPEFFTRFQEVYPEVINELLKIDPKLRVSELTLCAFIYLGFNTKDIAGYTYRTISTVRNRKHNLRTKLNIPAEETTELWFKNLGNRLY